VKSEEVVDIEKYFRDAFFRIYKENQKENIEFEQYRKNIEIMFQIAKVLFFI